MSEEEKEGYIFLAKLAEKSERYEEMLSHMKQAIQINNYLDSEERNLLSIAYRNVVLSRRKSWRIVKQQEKDSKFIEISQNFKKKLEDEIASYCDDLIKLIDNTLLKDADQEAEVFYIKLKGDYYRYMSEFSNDTMKDQYAKKSIDAYLLATNKIETGNIAKSDPIRLGLALNTSVYYYEIENKVEKACETAKSAFDGALDEIDDLSEDSYNRSISVLQLLKENLALWTADDE